MADNTERGTTTGGDTLRTDELIDEATGTASSKAQALKLMTGRDGVDGGLVTRARPLPIRPSSPTQSPDRLRRCSWEAFGARLADVAEAFGRVPLFEAPPRGGGSMLNAFTPAISSPPVITDPSSLNLSLWVRAGDYNSGTATWTGSGSAGSSGSRNLTEATSAPTNGSSLNGYTTVAFARISSQRLGNALALSNFITGSSYSVWVLANVTDKNGGGTLLDPSGNDAFVSDSGGNFILCNSLTNGGVAQMAHWDTAESGYDGQEAALSDGAWALVQAYYDGSNVYIRVNSGSWASAIGDGAIGDLTGSLRVGASYNLGSFYNGLIAEVGLSADAFSQATFDTIKTYINARYALSL